MIQNYPSSLQRTLKWEGGYSNNPHDPGGATMHGVTKRVYDAFRHRNGLPVRDVREITPLEIQAIYQPEYWDAAGCSHLPPGVDLVTFDAAVNSGVRRSLSWLQASQTGDYVATVKRFSAKRLGFLHSLRTWRTFGKGWAPRVAEMEAAGIRLASVSLDATGSNAPVVLHREAQEATKKAQRHAGTATVSGGSLVAPTASSGHIPWEAWVAMGFIGLLVIGISIYFYHIHTVRAQAFEQAAKEPL